MLEFVAKKLNYILSFSIKQSQSYQLFLLYNTKLGFCSARGAVVDFLSEPGFEPTTLGYLGFQVQRSIH